MGWLCWLAGAADQLTISGTVGLCNSTTKTAINLIRVPQQRQDLYQKFNLGTNPKPVFAFLGVFFGQKQIVTVVTGCTDPKATNYNAKATVDDGSCVFPPTALSGCTIAKAYNYNPKATVNDGSCKCPIVTGCTIVGDPNYNPQASVDDGTCKNYPTQVFGCMIKTDPNYNPAATLDDGSCKTYPVQILGCMMKGDPNYNALATIDDGSCTLYWQICR